MIKAVLYRRQGFLNALSTRNNAVIIDGNIEINTSIKY